MDETGARIISGVLILLLCAILYFVPAAVAWKKKRNFGAIFALNLLAGWTVVGWIGALIWALTYDAPRAQVIVNQAAPPERPVLCGRCGRYNPSDARFCQDCGRSMAIAAVAIALLLLFAAPAGAQQPCGAMGAWSCGSDSAAATSTPPADAQPKPAGCLIVKHKGVVGRRLMWWALIGVPIAPGAKYDYVDSIDIPSSKLTYHGDELEKIQEGGAHVVVLNDKFAASDLEEARKSCRESAAAK